MGYFNVGGMYQNNMLQFNNKSLNQDGGNDNLLL